jgi:hypothetical protein
MNEARMRVLFERLVKGVNGGLVLAGGKKDCDTVVSHANFDKRGSGACEHLKGQYNA